jgi:hypothetical protein
MSAISSVTGSFTAMAAGVRAMRDGIILRHVHDLAGLPDPSLPDAAKHLKREGQALIEAGSILLRHEIVGTLLDVVG